MAQEVRRDEAIGLDLDHQALHFVLELAHVARPVVGHQEFHRALREARHGAPHLARILLQEVPGQERDVVASLAQRRHADREDVESVVQVLTEAARFDLFLEVAVARRHDAHIDEFGVGGAHGTDLAFLQHPEQLRLERQRHLGDLVQEQGAAVGDVEEPALLFGGAGEGATLVAEELALEQVLGERGAVLRHEELASAPRAVVHGGRDELLAGARFALDQHAHSRIDHLVELLEQVANGAALPDDLGRSAGSWLAHDP